MGGDSIRSVPVGDIRRFGEHALLVGVQDARAARLLARSLTAAGIRGLREVVGGLQTVMVAFDPEEDDDVDAHLPLLRTLASDGLHERSDLQGDGTLVTVPCTFDGPDLAEVAEAVGCVPARVIELVTAQVLTAVVVGFSPGFAYLSGLPVELALVPRRARPRSSVPLGSVALANGFAAVYPTPSPGGWQLIGRTDEWFFTPDVPPYARLSPGDRVRFRVADGDANHQGQPPPATAERSFGPSSGRPVFEVAEAGLRTVLQDGGRSGLAALGVPAAGPADPYSFHLANRLVGNHRDACALEITARGPALRCLGSTFVAAVGASPELRLQGQSVAAGRVVPVNDGQQLEVGAVRGGLRSYLAVAGGFVGPAVLGSCATDQLSGLGPGPLARGARLWAAAPEPPMGDHLRDDASEALIAGGTVTLRVVPGPHPERFAAGTFASLGSVRFAVEGESNRVGVRLRRHAGTRAPLSAQHVTRELDSQGMVTGAVQVPPDGDPVILLPDHATLGGYPVVAVVAEVDHGALGQCAPGTTVVLVPIDHAQAKVALQRRRRLMEAAVMGHYPLVVE